MSSKLFYPRLQKEEQTLVPFVLPLRETEKTESQTEASKFGLTERTLYFQATSILRLRNRLF